jgi:hypothetical protein
MPGQVKDVHNTFPYDIAFECLADGEGLGELRGTAVHALHGLLELIDFNFGHAHHISLNDGGGHAIGAATPTARHDPLRFFRALFPHGDNTSSRWPQQDRVGDRRGRAALAGTGHGEAPLCVARNS